MKKCYDKNRLTMGVFQLNVLYVASQAKPYIDISELGDIAGALPKALCTVGVDCRIILPLFSTTKEEFKNELKKIATFDAFVKGQDRECTLYSSQKEGTTYYFIENLEYFSHFGFYSTSYDCERFAFFCRAVINAIPFMDEWIPDVIHCNNWECGAIPLYLRAFCRYDKMFSKIKTVFTIHNIEHQGEYDINLAKEVLSIPSDMLSMISYNGRCNFMKAAIDQCDVVTTVSRTYAMELLDPWHGLGMEKILKERKYKFTGILNGIDTDDYNPETDPNLENHYSSSDISGKRKEKKRLQKDLGLDEDQDAMLIGIVASMVSRKGLELIEACEKKLMKMNVQLAVLGIGQSRYVDYFKRMQRMFPGRVVMINEFNLDMAKRIYAGADAILLPCKNEPCGLTQMKAMRYGTVPIVREAGGLKDTVHDIAEIGGNGLTFLNFVSDELLEAVERALETFHSNDWEELVKKDMECDYSWKKSASTYKQLYQVITR